MALGLGLGVDWELGETLKVVSPPLRKYITQVLRSGLDRSLGEILDGCLLESVILQVGAAVPVLLLGSSPRAAVRPGLAAMRALFGRRAWPAGMLLRACLDNCGRFRRFPRPGGRIVCIYN